jgi:hypothetical protein
MSYLSADITQAPTTHLSVTEAFGDNYQHICEVIEAIPFKTDHGLKDVSLSLFGNRKNITQHPMVAQAIAANHLKLHQINYILDEVFSHSEDTALDPEVAALFVLMGKKPATLKSSLSALMHHIGGGITSTIKAKKLAIRIGHQYSDPATQNSLSLNDKLACGTFVCDMMLAMIDEGIVMAQPGHEPKLAINALKALYTTNMASIENLAATSQNPKSPAID